MQRLESAALPIGHEPLYSKPIKPIFDASAEIRTKILWVLGKIEVYTIFFLRFPDLKRKLFGLCFAWRVWRRHRNNRSKDLSFFRQNKAVIFRKNQKKLFVNCNP